MLTKNGMYQLSKAVAGVTYQIALKSAGLVSHFGWYQPKAPDKLCK